MANNFWKQVSRALGIVVVLAAVALVFYFLVTRENKITPPDDRLTVSTSFYPLTFLVEGIAGDLAIVNTITPAGAEPHEYEPTTQDLVAIEKSKLLFLNGAGFESWAEGYVSAGATIVPVADTLVTQNFVAGESVARDPHVWLDPTLAKASAQIVLDALVAADPGHEQEYKVNAETFLKQFDDLDAAFQAGLATCARRDIVTGHAAFGYLAARYTLTQVPISGLSPDEEPSPRRMAEVAEFVKNSGVEYIFFESLVNPELAVTIANEVGVKTLVLNPLEGLTPDEVSQGKNYFTEMRQNLAHLRTALQCQ